MKALSIGIIIVLGGLLFSCSIDSNPKMYRLTTTADPLEGGTVTPPQGDFEDGERVQLVATANQQWTFSRWEGDYAGTGATAMITMNGDKNVSAHFVVKTYPLSVEVQGEGSVDEKEITAKTTDYTSGTLVELTAIAAEGWQFAGWGGDLEGSENPVTIEVSGEKSVVAVFERKEYPLTVTVEGSGSVSEEVVHAKTTDYPYQTLVRLTAIPSEGWVFSGWGGALSGGENPQQLEVAEATTVTATFNRDYFSITVTYDGAGSSTIELVTGSQSAEGYEYESTVRVMAEPESGWKFIGWQGDLNGTENPLEVAVTGDITATAVFEQQIFEGEGTVEDPYKVATLEQLQAIRFGFLDKHFMQIADIDASATASVNNGVGFIPIAFTGSTYFTGSYDGGGYQISDLYINQVNGIYPESTYAGLFGKTKNAFISNVILTNVDITTSAGIWGTGGLVGLASTGSRIENVKVSGKITGISYVGGVAGILEFGEIIGSTATVAVEGNASIGGLIGAATEGRISASKAEGTVTGNLNVGGLIGSQTEGKSISGSFADVAVTGQKNVGGLIGSSTNTKEAIARSYASGDIFGAENVGGLVGFFSGFSSIGESYALGDVSSNNGTVVGGLIGILTTDSRLYKSYALGAVSGQSVIGGLIGRNSGQVFESFSAGLVSGASQYGGIAGDNQGSISDSYWDTEASGQNSPVWDPYQGVTDATALITAQMTGATAQGSMPDFDWINTWETSSEYPVLRLLPIVVSGRVN